MFKPKHSVDSVTKKLIDGFETGTIALKPSATIEEAIGRGLFGISIVCGTIVGALSYWLLHIKLPILESYTPISDKSWIGHVLGQLPNLPIFILCGITVVELIRWIFTFRIEWSGLRDSESERLYNRLQSISKAENQIIYSMLVVIPVIGFLGTIVCLATALSPLSDILSDQTPIGEQMELVISYLGKIGRAFDFTIIALAMTFVLSVFRRIVYYSQQSKILKFANEIIK